MLVAPDAGRVCGNDGASGFDGSDVHRSRRRRWLPALALAALPGLGAHAATIDARSAPIELVTVYPGAATIQRSVRVAAGTRVLVLDCLPSTFDVSLLRIDADPGVTIGPIATESRARAGAVECGGPLDARIRALEERIAALDAESDSQDLMLAYLKGMAGDGVPSSARGPGNAVNVAGLQTTLNAIRRAGQTALVEKRRIAAEGDALKRELLGPQSDRERLGQTDGKVVRLQIDLSAAQGGAVRLQYQFAGATWSPSYRVRLDTVAGNVTIDRMAEVTQSSGEDWNGVNLRLSTGSPRSTPAGPTPTPWRVAVAQPPAGVMPAAPAPMMARIASEKVVGPGETVSPFALQMIQAGFATEFVVPGKVDIAAASQRVALTLDTVRVPATVKVQASPQQGQSAWLVAEVDRPAGVWPDGPMRLQRDEQIVGQGVWTQGSRPRLTIPFGRDDLVRVQTNPSLQRDSSTGLIETRTEEQIVHVYEIENRHTASIALEVLEASPVSLDEQIKVVKAFDPTPAATAWMDQPGVVAWAVTLAPKQTTRFSATYTIGHPKDLRIQRR